MRENLVYHKLVEKLKRRLRALRNDLRHGRVNDPRLLNMKICFEIKLKLNNLTQSETLFNQFIEKIRTFKLCIWRSYFVFFFDTALHYSIDCVYNDWNLFSQLCPPNTLKKFLLVKHTVAELQFLINPKFRYFKLKKTKRQGGSNYCN